MKTLHKIVLAIVSSFAHGTSNPAPQGNRALEKMDALTPGPSPSPKQENRNPEPPQKWPLLQKVKEAWMNPKETAATIGVGMTYGIVIGALLLFAPSRLKASKRKARRKPLPLPKTPKVLEIHVDGLNAPTSGKFDISVVTDSTPAWTYYKWCWSGVYKSWWGDTIRYIDVLTHWDHSSYVSYWNYWNQQYYWQNQGSTYQCTIVSHGDGRHIADVGLDVRADAHFYLLQFQDGTFWPIGWITDSDGGSYYVPVIWNGTWYPGL